MTKVTPTFKVVDLGAFAKKYPHLVKVKKVKTVTEEYSTNDKKIQSVLKLGVPLDGVDIVA